MIIPFENYNPSIILSLNSLKDLNPFNFTNMKAAGYAEQ